MSRSFSDNSLVLILSDAMDLKEENIALTSVLAKNNYNVVIITSNLPASILTKEYELKGVEMKNVYFIDLITRYALGSNPGNSDSVQYISTPENLTEIGIAITKILGNIENDRIVFLFDSVTSMLIYTSSDKITRFLHFIVNKIRLKNSKGIFMATGGGINPALLMQLRTFVDAVIEDKEEINEFFSG
ncbi:DUF7504 family protein [Methanoplanus endosymbiosus]|uniref:KaiC-like domain-containing protein n=1 Tax=Methanoplanus endosymbiosus TaxID=33865 RepID=A0A9E7PQB4_9EURY|nr:hypothetical protein [Methanoplanus endosymbiosus]UUX93026.1 hypothetical protein L6E24_02550 [Methanoplanus endosymbiosus]